jgi:hypothetical protein
VKRVALKSRQKRVKFGRPYVKLAICPLVKPKTSRRSERISAPFFLRIPTSFARLQTGTFCWRPPSSCRPSSYKGMRSSRSNTLSQVAGDSAETMSVKSVIWWARASTLECMAGRSLRGPGSRASCCSLEAPAKRVGSEPGARSLPMAYIIRRAFSATRGLTSTSARMGRFWCICTLTSSSSSNVVWLPFKTRARAVFVMPQSCSSQLWPNQATGDLTFFRTGR